MNGWVPDKLWADQVMTPIKRILGEHLIGPAPVEEDQERNTDLIVMRMDAVRIAVRIRREIPYLFRYGGEFTIRFSRPSGMKTELAKIIEGWGDYLFYGFQNDHGKLSKWTLARLTVFRSWYSERLLAGSRPGKVRHNGDGSSALIAFRWIDLPDEFVIASDWPPPLMPGASPC